MDKHIDAVLIDNDPLVHLTWQFAADQFHKNLLVFQHPKEFFLTTNTIPYDTCVYIDSNLSHNLKGELVAKEIYTAGYTHIYLVTGNETSTFAEMPWLKKILDKTPPWL